MAGISIARDDIWIISLVDETIAECKRQLPHIKWHWLSGYKQDANGAWRPTADEVITTIERVGAAGLGSLAMPAHFDAEFVARLRTAGIEEFHVWTVDDPEVARFYAELGAWGITTNRPAFIREELAG